MLGVWSCPWLMQKELCDQHRHPRHQLTSDPSRSASIRCSGQSQRIPPGAWGSVHQRRRLSGVALTWQVDKQRCPGEDLPMARGCVRNVDAAVMPLVSSPLVCNVRLLNLLQEWLCHSFSSKDFRFHCVTLRFLLFSHPLFFFFFFFFLMLLL